MTAMPQGNFVAEIQRYGADPAALRLLDADGPDLLPYATLLTARSSGDKDLQAIGAVYEWQGTPLIFLVSAANLGPTASRLQRIRRLLAMRGDAPYLGVVEAGRLEVYHIALDDARLEQARVGLGIAEGQEIATLAHLANVRPGLPTGQRQWISQVVLKLLSDSIDALKIECGIENDDAISIVGRALFTRFLGDRHLLGALNVDAHSTAALFDDSERAKATSDWLDRTFNGDFLPTSDSIWEKLPVRAYKVLGDILRRAPDGQLYLGWQERWDNLDFAHIPVGVLSQAYEHYLHQHAPDRQRREGGYYTPRPIADLIVRGGLNAVGRSMPADQAHILDPSAGAGVFLLTAFRQLVAERWRMSGRRPDTTELRRILYEQITGFDINEAALRFAALGLYLISIELDAHPEPVRKLRFENLRNRVLLKLAEDNEERALGSLGPKVGHEHVGRYDLVVGNPPWATGTKLPGWHDVLTIVRRIARDRLSVDTPPPPLPNEVLDLPFVWRAMEWAKLGGQIAFALHARLLFQQGDGMQDARRALFRAIEVTGVVNGAELRQTRVWPEIDAPFCLLFARNRPSPPGSGFRLVSPRLEASLNSAGDMRIDATNAELVTAEEMAERPEILKMLFKGSRADVHVYDRLRANAPEQLGEYWRRTFESEPGSVRSTGNGYQRLKKSSRIRKNGDGEKGVPANYLHGRPLLTHQTMSGILVDTAALPRFDEARIHDPRSASLFNGPLLVVQKAPPAALGRIRTAVIPGGAVFNASFYGYSARGHRDGDFLVRYLSLLMGSKIALWQVLLTSGEFAFERDTIEKATIDRLWIPPVDALSAAQRERVAALFKALQEDETSSTWDDIDCLFAEIYHLRPRDLQIIIDTLEYNLPFSKNRRRAQEPVKDTAVQHFCDVLRTELSPWAERFGNPIDAVPINTLAASPWRGVRIYFGAPTQEVAALPVDWAKLLPLADHFAATEVMFAERSDCLWLGRLNQARYWSETQARLVAQRLAWEHMDLLKGQASA